MMEQVVAEMIRQSEGETEFRVNLNRILLHKEHEKNPLLSHFADERAAYELEVDVDLVTSMTRKNAIWVSVRGCAYYLTDIMFNTIGSNTLCFFYVIFHIKRLTLC